MTGVNSIIRLKEKTIAFQTKEGVQIVDMDTGII